MAENIAAAKMMAYDDSFLYKCELYDNLPYVRTYERCNEHTVCVWSGNVIKNMSYMITEPVVVSNRDEEFSHVLENLRLEASVVAEEDYEGEEEDENDAIVAGLMSEYVEPEE